MSTSQIAAQTGFHPTTVLFYVHRAGLPIQPTGSAAKFDIGRKDLAKLRRDGLMLKEIAERFGCSEGTVQRALSHHGLARG
jgi:DNA-binding CsgD family transcriptional regulator